MPRRYSPSTITGSAICSARARTAARPGSSSAAADRALVSRIISGKSLPDFPIDLLERFFHPLFDLLSLLMQVFEPSDVLHPGPFLGGSFQFLLDRLGDELAQGNTALGGGGFCAAEQEIGDFESRLHVPILPYLWVQYEKVPVCISRFAHARSSPA